MVLRSITLPAPIPFPRRGYGDVLGDHARLVAANAGALHVEVRKRIRDDEELDMVDHYAARITATGSAADDRVDVQHRETVVRYWRAYRGIAGRLLDERRPYRLDVVVASGCAVSVHRMRLDGTQLTPAGHALVVEPMVQRHRVSGLAPLLVTRWVEPDGEARFAWVPVPSEPSTPAEALDRLLVRHDAAVRRALAKYQQDGGTNPFVLVRSDSLGDSVDVHGRGAALRARRARTRPSSRFSSVPRSPGSSPWSPRSRRGRACGGSASRTRGPPWPMQTSSSSRFTGRRSWPT